MFNYKSFWWWVVVLFLIFLIWWLVSLVCHRAWAPSSDDNLNQTSTLKVTGQWETQKGNSDILRQLNLQVGQKVSNNFVLKGEARGTWFFEASFPWRLENESGKILGQGIATAQTDWMTENWVPFEATLQFEAQGATTGRLILKKDNPSGLPENEDNLEIAVSF